MNKVILWAASYSACVIYTKTIIHLSVGESGGYLPPLRWIIFKYPPQTPSGAQGYTVIGMYILFTNVFWSYILPIRYVFDYHPGEVYWCTADIGWITGHSYITYGPLANGATSVLVCKLSTSVIHCLLWEGNTYWLRTIIPPQNNSQQSFKYSIQYLRVPFVAEGTMHIHGIVHLYIAVDYIYQYIAFNWQLDYEPELSTRSRVDYCS